MSRTEVHGGSPKPRAALEERQVRRFTSWSRRVTLAEECNYSIATVYWLLRQAGTRMRPTAARNDHDVLAHVVLVKADDRTSLPPHSQGQNGMRKGAWQPSDR
ncbi:hypothetical protein ACF09Y_05680 [Streptomyces massasporeus]|uniref:hypothetical protein n=1 Tax=Streptomyces massasporeus TaxID=67324 RepID=UPI0036FDE8F1